MTDRPCTCHPDDNPPQPCQKKYALGECRAAAEPVAWLVLDEEGQLEFAAGWREAAHEHINDAINEHDIEGAKNWTVRPVYAAPSAEVERLRTLLAEARICVADTEMDGLEPFNLLTRIDAALQEKP